jgi:hypothetical protein
MTAAGRPPKARGGTEYSEERLVAAAHLAKVPSGVDRVERWVVHQIIVNLLLNA